MSLLITLGLGSAGVAPPTPPAGDTPWMHMLLPIVTVTIGPEYATEINNALGITVDSHDHSPTKGKPVPTSGLNINADLTFAGHSALNLDSSQYNIRAPVIPGSIGYLYFSGVDLYVIDGNGVTIQITSGGSVNVTGTGGWTGDYGSGTSTASFTAASKTFALINAAGQRGFLSTGDILLRQAASSAATAELTLRSPFASSTGGYTLLLPIGPVAAGFAANEKRILQVTRNSGEGDMGYGPAAPASTKGVRVDSTGALSYDLDVDGVTIEWPGGVLDVKDAGISTAKIADGAVTPPKLAAQANGVSGDSGVFTTTSASFVDVCTLTIVTVGGRFIQLICEASSSAVAFIGSNGAGAFFRWLVDGSNAGSFALKGDAGTGSTDTQIPPGALNTLLGPLTAPGAHTIKLQALGVSGATATVNKCRIVAFET